MSNSNSRSSSIKYESILRHQILHQTELKKAHHQLKLQCMQSVMRNCEMQADHRTMLHIGHSGCWILVIESALNRLLQAKHVANRFRSPLLKLCEYVEQMIWFPFKHTQCFPCAASNLICYGHIHFQLPLGAQRVLSQRRLFHQVVHMLCLRCPTVHLSH